MSGDSHLFHSNLTDSRMPLYEGGLFWHYDSHFSSPRYFLEESDIRGHLPKRFPSSDWQTCDDYKLGFRAIASPTNERTLTTSILPKRVVCNHNVSVVLTKNLCDSPQFILLTLMSIANSFTLDWFVRIQGTTYLKFQNISALPLPESTQNTSGCIDLVARASRMLCTIDVFGTLWTSAFSTDWKSPTFWYSESAPIDSYGPAHEKEIRRRLRDQAKNLTPEWGPHCGVHDRLPDRRDTRDRAQLRAEIDAYAAHLYGLSRDDFAYILDTFPVLKKKEKKAFGEFMSKCKCLEEYDWVKTIMNAEG